MENSDPPLSDTNPALAAERGGKWRRLVLWILAGSLICLIFAASWAQDSQMVKLGWVPGWVGILADRDPNIRTAVPFIPLSFLLMGGLWRLGSRAALAWTIAVSGSCLGLSEFGQTLLPHRTADVRDLLWGGCGILVGTALGWMFSQWRRW